MRRALALAGLTMAFGVLVSCTAKTTNTNIPVNTSAFSNANAAVVANVNTSPPANVNVAPVPSTNTNIAPTALVSPLDRRAERVTKKLFGTYITPKTSPIQPERFTGYHTGLDYETFASEAKVDVPVIAACTGKVRALQTVSGYGGVLVQQCVVDGQTLTALYGHLRLSSISVKTGTTLKAGTKFAVLGTGFTSETSGERKHLHFSLHKGTAIVWKGYVGTKGALVDWLDPQKYF